MRKMLYNDLQRIYYFHKISRGKTSVLRVPEDIIKACKAMQQTKTHGSYIYGNTNIRKKGERTANTTLSIIIKKRNKKMNIEKILNATIYNTEHDSVKKRKQLLCSAFLWLHHFTCHLHFKTE